MHCVVKWVSTAKLAAATLQPPVYVRWTAGSGCIATALSPRLRICLAKIDWRRRYRNIYKRDRARVFETVNITLRKPHYVTGLKRLSLGTAEQQSTGTRDCNPDLLRCFMPIRRIHRPRRNDDVCNGDPS